MDAALFPILLGQTWPQLAAPVRQIHGDTASITTRGSADVSGAANLPARLLRQMLGLPSPGRAQPVEVWIERRGRQETWTRIFATGRMRSVLSEGRGRSLRERLGPVTLRFALDVDGDAISWRLLGATIFGLPLPRPLLGRVSARSGAENGRYLFAIEAQLPLLGTWIAYRGHLDIA